MALDVVHLVPTLDFTTNGDLLPSCGCWGCCSSTSTARRCGVWNAWVSPTPLRRSLPPAQCRSRRQVRTDRLHATCHDSRHEAVDHRPGKLNLGSEGVSQNISQDAHQTLRYNVQVLLLGSVVHMTRAEFPQPGDQLLRVVESSDSIADGTDDLGPQFPHGRRLEQVILASRLVSGPIAVLESNLLRKQVHRLRSMLEEIAVEELTEVLDSQGLKLFPTLLDRGFHLVCRLHAPRARGGRGAQTLWQRRHWRCGWRLLQRRHGVTRRKMGKHAAAFLKVPQALLQLHRMAARYADVLHVGILYLEQCLHIIEATLHQELRVLAQAYLGQEDYNRMVVIEQAGSTVYLWC
mmetsp:Transcript_82802/g.208505  ORF Transcript_82802/g.208505 Transcript_82802/m.208505 type:complete len:349 (-) Transcript_82802:359-1405(-)